MTAPEVKSTISDTLFNAGRDNNISNAYNHYGDNIFAVADPLACLQQHCALGALHDAAERLDPPKCHENTRIAILDRIDRWARDKSIEAKPVLWLSGAAGSGKSAIAQTLVERWRKDMLIVPNFFLWRTSAKRNQKTYVLPTIAFQLTKLLPEIRPIIEEDVRDRSIFEQNLKAQMEALIVNPLRAAQTDGHPVVIVLDGLDECCVDLPRTEHFPGQSYENQQRDILDAIAFACQKLPSLRVLIASRPERQIRKSFAGKPLTALTHLLSLNDESDTTADIALYLDCEFAGIRSEYPGIDPAWPYRQHIAKLVEKASGQFIYPSVVTRYISRSRQYPPISLEEVLSLRPMLSNKEDHPLAELDALYALVLKTVPKDSLPTVMTVLGLLIFYPDNLFNIFWHSKSGYNTTNIERFLFLRDGELLSHLVDLHSILSISTNPQDGFTKIGFSHATLSEYLKDQSRSGDFFVKESDVDLQVSLHLLKHANVERPPNPDVYDSSYLYICLAAYGYSCPPSIDLMKGLWSHLKDEIGEYAPITGSNPNLETSQSIHMGDPPKYFQGVISHCLDTEDRCQLLGYLQRCNILEIEPSSARRRAIGAHLQYLWKLVDPEGKWANLFPVLSAQDTEGTGDSEEKRGEECKPSHSLSKVHANDRDGSEKKGPLRRLWSGLSFRKKI